MGLYIRKSVRFGPFRVNFSNAGVGISAGIPGFRVGSGSRGNYVQIGGHGIYYRASLSAPVSARSATAVPLSYRPPAPDTQAIPDNTLGAFQTIESQQASSISDSSSEALLTEIRQKHKQVRACPWVLAAMVPAVALSVVRDFPLWASVVIGVVLAVAALFAYRWDLRRKLVILHYSLDEASGQDYQALFDGGSACRNASRTWHISASAKVLDQKYHAGASSTVRRKRASVSYSQPPFMASNINPVAITLSKNTFYFFPDRLLVYSNRQVGAIAYSNLRATASICRFIEEEGVPPDATIVDKTWKFVNKKGGPDRRFKNNRQLPICAYGRLALNSDAGIDELLIISQQGPEVTFSAALARISSKQTAVRSKIVANR